MKSACLPSSAVPHVSRLFADVTARAAAVRPFYPAGFEPAAVAGDYPAERRLAVAAALERQNREWGASPATLENIARLRNGASAVVTGQQVGLFGGPLFAIYKALTAVKLAAEAQAGGVDCVPVFWLATTDHDLAEVNHISIPGADGSLQRLETTSHAAA